jgi:hypothetical protein
VVLPFGLPPLRVLHAVRALEAVATVACGRDATPRAVERLHVAITQADRATPLFTYLDSDLVTRGAGVRSLGSSTVDAVAYLRAYLDERAEPEPAWGAIAARSDGGSAAVSLAASR